MQDIPIDFSVKIYENFIDIVSDSHCSLYLKKNWLSTSGVVSKDIKRLL